MKLRSGKLTKESSKPPSRESTPRMSNPSSNVDEVPVRSLGISDTVVSQVVPLPSVSNPVSIVNIPVSQAPPVSPRTTTVVTEMPYVPRLGIANPIYGMPYSVMPGVSTFNPAVTFENIQNLSSPLQGSAPGGSRGNQGLPYQPIVSSLTNTSVAVLRQQMDDSNHELVNMLTNQMGNVFNPIVQELVETNRQSAETNRQVIAQLTRLCNFLGAPKVPVRQVPLAI